MPPLSFVYFQCSSLWNIKACHLWWLPISLKVNAKVLTKIQKELVFTQISWGPYENADSGPEDPGGTQNSAFLTTYQWFYVVKWRRVTLWAVRPRHGVPFPWAQLSLFAWDCLDLKNASSTPQEFPQSWANWDWLSPLLLHSFRFTCWEGGSHSKAPSKGGFLFIIAPPCSYPTFPVHFPHLVFPTTALSILCIYLTYCLFPVENKFHKN